MLRSDFGSALMSGAQKSGALELVDQNRLGPSGGIYYPNFVPCFVVVQLNRQVLCTLSFRDDLVRLVRLSSASGLPSSISGGGSLTHVFLIGAST